jgi:murein DD-endopeptidase MepM/ murein hydrolase activator NlpD
MGMRIGAFLLAAFLAAIALRSWSQHKEDSEKLAVAGRLGAETLEPSDGFDFPVGSPDGAGYYNAQAFGENHHLGEDWNGNGGGDTDLGDPVRVLANGVVLMASDAGQNWGNVVRVVHNAGTAANPKLVESLYAHLDSMRVSKGQVVRRGDTIGSIGTANGSYLAHLHLELRGEIGMPLGPGYSQDARGYLDPTAFIKANRATQH